VARRRYVPRGRADSYNATEIHLARSDLSIAKTSSPSIFISLQSWAEYLLR
jgi:hypothetical protein